MRQWLGTLALGFATLAQPQVPQPAAGPPSSAPVRAFPNTLTTTPEPSSEPVRQPLEGADVNWGCPPTQQSATRRRPGQPAPEGRPPPDCDTQRLPTPATAGLPRPAPVNRWRVIDALGRADNWHDPYATNNPLKGDRPIIGRDVYFSVTASSNSLLEARRAPATPSADGMHLKGLQQVFASETASIDMLLYRGDTIFRPPDYQLRLTPVFNYSATRTNGAVVTSNSVGAQALFLEKHLRDSSAHYDFDSIRVGIQPITSDFRGFVFAEQPLGLRLFGAHDNDVYQYNIGWFRRLPKNASRQNELGAGLPANDIVMANLYVQDLGHPGVTSEFLLIYDRNRAPGTQIVAPLQPGGIPATYIQGARHDYDVAYLGYSADGHLGWLNLTASLYGALGREAQSVFGTADSHVQAAFAAAELSRDFDWIRVRASGLYASGDADPSGKRAHGFDGISQSALFAGADSTFFIHQRLPLPLSQIDLKARDSVFPDLRSVADSGQSNYENPGLRLLGLGVDLDLAPALRISLNVNHLWFDQTATVEAVLGRAGLARDIGEDVALDATYRPFDSQNLILRLSVARLLAATAARDLMGGSAPFSAFCSLALTY